MSITETAAALRAEARRLRGTHRDGMPVSQSNLCRADDLEHEARQLERIQFEAGLEDFLALAYPDLGEEYQGVETEWSYADGSPKVLPQEMGRRAGEAW